VDANGQPPVCRILDYGKFKYEQAKRERDARKHQRGTMIHEVRLRPRTGQHDIDLKVKIARRLLAEGDKVKLAVMFRGREISHPEVGREVLDKAIAGIGEEANIEKPPGMEGRFLTVILTPTVKKPTGGKGSSGAGPGPSGEGPPTAGPSPNGPEPAGATEAKAEAVTAEDDQAEPAAAAPKNEG
jgi:translation initiation factor IF-3